MTRLSKVLALDALTLAGCGRNAASAADANAANAKLSLPLYEEAVTMKHPVLPARMMDGDCPEVDQCEFGTEWRTCQAIPLYRDAADRAPVLRRLKAIETFVAEGGEIELVAPGAIAITDVTYSDETGGRSMDPGPRSKSTARCTTAKCFISTRPAAGRFRPRQQRPMVVGGQECADDRGAQDELVGARADQGQSGRLDQAA